MNLLVIGGTHFVGRAVVEDAVARGHDVTVFHRGADEPEGFPDVEHLHGDRDGGVDVLRGRGWDAALDTCGYVPRVVRDSAQLLADAVGTYAFISSLSALPDEAPAGSNEDTPTYQPPFPDTEEITNESYGPLKVACEREAQAAFPGRCLIVRPGYIVGPHDPTDRFTYWVRRARTGGEMLAPGPGDDALQVVDVRDLGAFTLDHLEKQTADVFGVVGPPELLTWSTFLPLVCEVAGSGTSLTWVDRSFLESQLGEDLDESFPQRDYPYQSLHRYDGRKAIAAGLTHRPLSATIADTIAWDRDRGPLKAGISSEREHELLATWRASASS
ncbi:MAG: NAD-dependent epimerase/dehydratase family protein [Actinomycetota bacterium]